ncbi:hypothetical protein ACHAXR_013198 [Thalassiosira sp. AJA248-18]
MEELQDAIEDAQYVSAISSVEDGPRPVLPWENPEVEELANWKASVLKKHEEALAKKKKKTTSNNSKTNITKNDPSSSSSVENKKPPSPVAVAVTASPPPPPFEFEWTLAHALGFFLFSAYLKESVGEYIEINFMEEVLRWRGTRGRFRAEKTSFIVANYFAEFPEGTVRPEPAPAVVTPPPVPEGAEAEGGGAAAVENGDGEKGFKSEEGASAPAAPAPAAPPPRPKVEVGEGTPPKTEIDEYDLAREPPAFTPDDIQEILSHSSEPNKNCVGVGGKVLESILSRVDKLRKSPGYSSLPEIHENSEENDGIPKKEDVQGDNSLQSTKKRSFRNLSLVSNELPENLFDEAEVIVAENLRERYWVGFQSSPYHSKLLNFLWFQDRTVVEEDFFVMRVLGRGGFGLVTACKKGTSGKLYAMKVMNKKRIKIKKAEQLTLNEQKCLADINSPFVVNLKYSFQSSTDVFLILDLMTGGDLSYHLSLKGCFTKKECLYYSARIMLGLQALHDRGYVYRDLKPENCLLGEDGRVKLTDLGLATVVTSTLHGAAGTRGYWAPEMLRRDEKGKRKNYGHMVDWFSFGCCLAEFISGTNPFRSEVALNFGLEKGKKTKEKAIDCATLEMHPEFDSNKFSEDAADLCRSLLDKKEATRLGVNGCSEIMSHPWFRELNWEEIISDRMRPPFIPPKDVNAASQSEIGTFAEDKTFHETELSEKDEAVYKNWNFTNNKAFAAEVIEFLIYERETGEPLLPIQQNTSCCCTII